jgi:nitroreductase
MAYALGYTTCWIGSFIEEKVAKVIEAPEEIRPLVIIPLGKPAREPKTPPKRDLENIVHEEKYGGKR